MPVGIKVWNSSGGVVLDSTTLPLRVPLYTSSTITAATSVTVSAITTTSVLVVEMSNELNNNSDVPTVTMNTSTKVVTVSGTGSFSLVFYIYDLF